MINADDIVTAVDLVRDAVTELRTDQTELFKQLLAALRELNLEVTETKWAIERMNNSLDDAARSLKALEDHFMPPNTGDDFP
jgi:hypothetical protein